MRKEIRIAGFGGQGVVTLSMLLVKAANLYAGKNATQTDAYGPQARGGSCWAEVVISDEEVDYPKAVLPDYAILLSQEAVSTFGRDVKGDGMIFTDPTTVKEPKVKKGIKLYQLPVQKIAIDEFRSGVVANVIMLGAFLKITGLLPLDAARETVKSSVPEKAIDMNMKAFERGIKLAEETGGGENA